MDKQKDNKENNPKRKKLRKRIIAVVVVVCTLNNVIFYSLKNSEAYASSLVIGGLCVSGDAIGALLGTALLAAGIISTNESIENYDELTAEEQAALNEDIYNEQISILDVLLDEGCLGGTGLEELVAAAACGVGIDGTAALNAYNEMQDAENQLKLIEPNNGDDNGNKWASIAVTAGALGQMGEDIWNALSSWAKKKHAESVNVVLPAKLPDAQISYDSTYANIYMVYVTVAGDVVCLRTQHALDFSDGRNNSTHGQYSYWLNHKIYAKYHIVDGAWEQTEYHYENYGNAIDFAQVDGKKNSYGEDSIARILYNNYPVTFCCHPDMNLPINEYQGGQSGEELPDEQLEQKVNEYLDSIGITSRYSQPIYEAAQKENFFEDIETELDDYGVTTPALIIDQNRDNVITKLTIPVTNALADTLPNGDINIDGVKQTVAEGAQDLANDIDISPGGAGDLPGTPYTPTLGSSNKYTVDGLEDVFPFCIPFDIFRCVEVMAAEGEAPYVEYPFVMERWGINEVIVFDMSKFEGVAAVSRWLESLIFIYGLASKTKSVMSW